MLLHLFFVNKSNFQSASGFSCLIKTTAFKKALSVLLHPALQLFNVIGFTRIQLLKLQQVLSAQSFVNVNLSNARIGDISSWSTCTEFNLLVRIEYRAAGQFCLAIFRYAPVHAALLSPINCALFCALDARGPVFYNPFYSCWPFPDIALFHWGCIFCCWTVGYKVLCRRNLRWSVPFIAVNALFNVRFYEGKLDPDFHRVDMILLIWFLWPRFIN